VTAGRADEEGATSTLRTVLGFRGRFGETSPLRTGPAVRPYLASSLPWLLKNETRATEPLGWSCTGIGSLLANTLRMLS
jgi:hypothetical protein